ncbi:MAG: substrate-binding domain-containing protein [Candidatus Poribacteria bacterium]|nr:substrate-binding domain-containing protein [Candidatus Poribacteria bacterium]
MFPMLRLLAVLLFAGIVCGCSDGIEADAPRVGVLMPTGTGPVPQIMREGMTQYAADQRFHLFWRDGDKREVTQTPANYEREQLADLIAKQRIDTLIYTPAKKSDPAFIFADARAAGVKIVSFDTIPRNFTADAFVTTAWRSAGVEAALACVEYLREVGRHNVEGNINALVVEGTYLRDWERDVATGFYDILDNSPEVRVVGRTTAKNPTESFQFTSREINNYAGNVQLLLIASTDTVSGAILAARTHGLVDWVVSAGVGAGEEACRLIVEDVHDYEIDLMPKQRAILAANVAYRLAQGSPLPPEGTYKNGEAEVPVYYGYRRVISKENVNLMQPLWKNLYPQ